VGAENNSTSFDKAGNNQASFSLITCSILHPDSRVCIRSYCALYSRRGQNLSGETCPLSRDISFPPGFFLKPPAPPCPHGHPPAMLAPRAGCPPGPVASRSPTRRVEPTTVPRETAETMHPCMASADGHGMGWAGTGDWTGPRRDICHPCPTFHPKMLQFSFIRCLNDLHVVSRAVSFCTCPSDVSSGASAVNSYVLAV
jgi:hypothetical protein